MPASKKGDKKDKSSPGPTVLKGVYMFPNGDKYDGEHIILDEGGLQRQGTGEHVTSDGLLYQGQWSDDRMNGKGKLTHPSGAVYNGDFVDNMFHGFGRYTWPDGSYYEGNFNENKLEGSGEFTDTSQHVWYGTFTHKAAPGLRFKLNT